MKTSKHKTITQITKSIIYLGILLTIGCDEKIDTSPIIIVNDYEQGYVTDIDGNTYRTVIINDLEWMSENLRTTRYNNEEIIYYPYDEDPRVANDLWGNDSEGAVVWYVFSDTLKIRYGGLYNWYAVNNPNGLCPEGWRVSSDDDWSNLTKYLINNYDNINSYNVGYRLKSCLMLEPSSEEDSCVPIGMGLHSTTVLLRRRF